MESLRGSVERITFYNAENGYSVLRLKPEGGRQTGVNRDGLVTVVGNLPELTAGEHLQLKGQWANHPKHGMQFQVEICEKTLPATLAGIRRYMGSGLIKGIGPRLADRIVDHFGLQTLEVIEQHPERLAEVPDIGPRRSRQIARAWDEQKQVKEIMLFLHGHGVSTNLAIKIFKQYGDESLAIVQNDPYRLARDIYGVGFKTADRIAQALGLPADHPSRLEAGVVFVLNEMVEEGHVFSVRGNLIERSTEMLEVEQTLVERAIVRLAEENRVRLEQVPLEKAAPDTKGAGDQQEAVYLTPLFNTEKSLAERLRSLAAAWPSRLSDLPPVLVSLDPLLSSEQQAAIRSALSHPLSILTGGPGTGKTTALKALIAALESASKTYALASPTGRAAKRLSQATDRSAKTLHRLLSYSPGEGFKHNAENQLPFDVVVVDEASMLDLMLANALVRALQPGTHLVLVGDVDQLPSVGAGDVLRDIIRSGLAAVTTLQVIFRQAAHSRIITNAHRIHQGEMPLFPSTNETDEAQLAKDFFLFPTETPEDTAQWVQDVVVHRIPQKFGLHPLHEIQVLSPMYRGPAGVSLLNERLQLALNPEELMKPEKRLFGQVFRVGDKLMQVKNNYDKEVFNGDMGFLFGIDFINQTLTMDFEGKAVVYDWSEADQLVHAYAVSVHKSQGSEFPAVVIPIITQHYMMLQRNLLYTAITRARQLCVLVGSRKAIQIAVRNNQVAQRCTALDYRLQGL